MNACKSYRRQIALRSVQALGESESAAVLDHLRECPACQAYAKQLESIVGVYTQDAERPIAPITAMAHFKAQRVPWFTWLFASPRPALVMGAALLVCAAVLLNRPERDSGAVPARTANTIQPRPLPTVPSIGNSRHLTAAELDRLTELPPRESSSGMGFVYSVGTRDDGF